MEQKESYPKRHVLEDPDEADPGSLICIMCEGVTDLSYCVRTVNCTAGQECFAEQVIGDDAAVFYNAGCKDSRICRASGHQSFQVRDKIQVCEKCCGQNLCNKNLCKSVDAASENKSCYLCDDIDDPLKCENKTTCSSDQQCFIQEYLNERYEKKYRLGCETRKRCELLTEYSRSRRDTSQLCNECCHTRDCNRNLCKEENSTVPLSLSSGVPTGTTTIQKACIDSSTVNCTELDGSLHICRQKTEAALTYCPQFCGFCMGPTTPPPCIDSTSVNCTEMNTLLHICAQKTDAALMYCPMYCGFCQVTNTTEQGATTVPDITSLGPQSSRTSPDALTLPSQNVLTTIPPMNFTVGQCEDSSVVPCAQLDQTLKICTTPTGPSAATCPKYCKFC